MTIPIIIPANQPEYLKDMMTAYTLDLPRSPANREVLRWYRIAELIRRTNRTMYATLRLPVVCRPTEPVFKKFCVNFIDHGTLTIPDEDLQILRDDFQHLTKRTGDDLDNIVNSWVQLLCKTVIESQELLPSATN